RRGVLGRERTEIVERTREHVALAGRSHADRPRAEEGRRRGCELRVLLRDDEAHEAVLQDEETVERLLALARAARLRLEARREPDGDEMAREGAVPARIEGGEDRPLRAELRERELLWRHAERQVAVERSELRLEEERPLTFAAVDVER